MMAHLIRCMHVRDATRGTTVTIRIAGVRSFRLRLWAATRLLRLAALIMPVETTVEIEA